MKKLLIISSVFLIAVCAGCSDSCEILSEGGQDESDVGSFENDVSSNLVDQAKIDFDSLETIGGYLINKGKVYFFGELIEGADASTFEALDEDYAMDKNEVYFGDKTVDGADVESFKSMGRVYGKDKNSFYYGAALIVEDPGIIYGWEPKSEDGIYLLNGYLWKDGEKISRHSLSTLKNGKINLSDKKSFEAFEWNRYEVGDELYIFLGIGYIGTTHAVNAPEYLVINKKSLDIKFGTLNNIEEKNVDDIVISPDKKSLIFIDRVYPENYDRAQKNWIESIWYYDLLTQQKTFIRGLGEDETVICGGFDGYDYTEGVEWGEGEEFPVIKPHSRSYKCK